MKFATAPRFTHGRRLARELLRGCDDKRGRLRSGAEAVGRGATGAVDGPKTNSNAVRPSIPNRIIRILLVVVGVMWVALAD